MLIGQSKEMWQCKWPNLVANFGTYTSGAIWWPHLELIQVAKCVTNANGAIWRSILQLMQVAKIGTHGNCITYLEPMLVAPPVSQILNLNKWNHIQLAKFGTNASGILFSGEITQDKESGYWVFNLNFLWDWICILFSCRDISIFRLYTLGPLCLWQCFSYGGFP